MPPSELKVAIGSQILVIPKRNKQLARKADRAPIWQRVDPGTRDVTFTNVKELWDAAVKYFNWVDENPIEDEQFYMGKKVGTVLRPRPMSMRGFASQANTTRARIQRACAEDEAMADILETINDIMHEQKFGYAAVNMMNAMIISRDLGLSDKTELTGAGGGPIQTEEVSSRDLLTDRLARIAAARGSSETDQEPE